MYKPFIPKKKFKILKKITFWTFTVLTGFTFLGILSVAGLFAFLSMGLPDVSNLETLNAAQSTEIFDRNGNVLYTIHGEENREKISYKDISPYLVSATISVEDSEFWNHKGFDIWALGKVALHEAFGIGVSRGGSTITQQYIKNTFFSSEKSYLRKAKELILAIRLEKAYDKKTIMELYLNRIPYGNNAYGTQKAAEIYFDKDASDLTLAESTILASLPQAPSRYNPYGNNKYSHLLKEFTEKELKNRNIKTEYDLEIDEYARGLLGNEIVLGNGNTVYIPGRTDLVLKNMKQTGAITKEEKENALKELKTIEFNDFVEDIKYPHFVFYIKEQLEEKYGKEIVEQGGLKVYTTIDPELQDKAEEIALEKGDHNEKKYGTNNVSILTINAKTGEILAMVGSRDYWNEEIDGNVNVSLRPRQPGSSFKPFVYAQAFINGYAPGSVVYDIRTKIGAAKPDNYDGSFMGQINLRKGLAQSRNIPAIKAYYLAGEQKSIIDLVEKMGINTLDQNHDYGYPLALGVGEIPLIEMVTAFAVFANNGKKPELTGISRIENANGDIIEEWKPKEFEEVLDPQIAYLINNILSDPATGIGPNLFVNGKINAAKTGTSTKSNKQKTGGSVKPGDAWTIGYTPTIVTGVWTGNSDGKGLALNANGYDTAGPIFKAVMTEALKDLPTEPFPEPEGIQHVKIGKASGKLPGTGTPESMTISEIFPSFSVPTEKENLYFKVKIDTISGKKATEYTPEETIKTVTFQKCEPIADLLNWKVEVASYCGQTVSKNGDIIVGLPPTEYDDVHTKDKTPPKINITSPASNNYLKQGNFNVNVSITAVNNVAKVEYYINNKLQYQTSVPPYTGHLNISKFMTPGSSHLIVAKVTDSIGYSSQSAVQIKVKGNGEISTKEEDNKKIPTIPSITTPETTIPKTEKENGGWPIPTSEPTI